MARKPQRPQRRTQGRESSGEAAASRRKAAIDRGLTADKVPGFDPAAAPLGTDAEAAGAPPLSEALGVAADLPLPEGAHVDPAGLAADPSGTDRRRYRMQDRMVWPAIIVAVLIAAAIIIAVLFARG
jgi:hypothetical protein